MRNPECGMRSERSKRCVVLWMVLCAGFLASVGEAADDPVQKAMKAYEKHRYEEAAHDLRQTLPGLPAGKKSAAQLVLGMIALRSAELHRELAGLSVAVNSDYLRRLAAQRSGRSRYCTLFLGLAELEAGREGRATKALDTFLAGTQDPGARTIARIAQGSAALLRGGRQEAEALWAEASGDDPEVKAALADALSRAGKREPDPTALCDGAVTVSQKGGKTPSIDVVKSCVGVYARSGATDKGAGLLERADLKAYSYRESLGKSKVISFYDVRLLPNLADHLLAVALEAFVQAAADPQLKSIANYYLGEAHMLAGNGDDAAKALAVFLSSPQAPPQVRNRAMVLQGAIQYKKGQRTEAVGTWDDLIKRQPGDPELFADILSVCGTLRIDCPRPAQAGAALAEKGEGRRFAALHIGLGRYYLGRKDDGRAQAAFEAGRDKGNKNKIEFNDPLMMTALAGTYYRTKKYSEALEIFFEMSKQFPQVRQVQEAFQGIYSMEQKSAGDVKIN